ncbi:MAG: hypothetical protein LUD27_02510 [Clostridia bacterium]|nr:hypothetical protein [Clostridia bacterium]
MFYIDEGRLCSFAYCGSGITVSEIVRRLNELADTEEVKQLKPKQVFDWLEENGFGYSFENPGANKENRRQRGKADLSAFTRSRE